MHFIVYTSESTLAESEVEAALKDIAATSMSHNTQEGITGVLFYDHGRFLQALEGEEHKIRRMVGKIEKDPRHRDIRILVDEEIKERSFAGWSMDTFFISSPDIIDRDVLAKFREIYSLQFEMNSEKFIIFLKTMVEELDTFKILHAEC